jgi:hypothetical protein
MATWDDVEKLSWDQLGEFNWDQVARRTTEQVERFANELWQRALREECGADRRCGCRREVSGLRGCIHLSENGVVLRTGLSNREHRDRMPQRDLDHQGRAPPYDDR